MRDVSRILISLSYVAAFLAVVWLKREKIGQKQGEMAFSEVNKYYNVQLEKYSGTLSDHFCKLNKVGCVFAMVIVSILPHAEFGPNKHQEDGPYFKG